jgi:cob(I)alamin adenosyltransferase
MRITTKYKEGKGDCPCPTSTNKKETKESQNQDYGNCFSIGDEIQARLSVIIYENNLTSKENEILNQTINAISDGMANMYSRQYDISHLGDFVDLLESEISQIKKITPSCHEFVRFNASPGIYLNLVRALVRKMEGFGRGSGRTNNLFLKALNRISSYLWWLAWSYHYNDKSVSFWEKA